MLGCIGQTDSSGVREPLALALWVRLVVFAHVCALSGMFETGESDAGCIGLLPSVRRQRSTWNVVFV